MPELIDIPPIGFYLMIGGAKYLIREDNGRLMVRCSDGGEASSGDRLFTHMPSGNQVLIETH